MTVLWMYWPKSAQAWTSGIVQLAAWRRDKDIITLMDVLA